MPHPPLRSDFPAEVSPLSEPEILLQELWGFHGLITGEKRHFFQELMIVDADFLGTISRKLRQAHEHFGFDQE